MDIRTNIPLKNYLTMKIGGPARFITSIHKVDELQQVCQNAKSKNIPILVVGGGSNIIVKDDGFNGLVILNKISGFKIIDDNSNATTIKIGAGENWDDIVKKTVDMNLSGIEAMSGIPGTIGATPVQNVGAYGQEIANTLLELTAYDTKTDKLVTLSNQSCEFSYRTSIFRKSARDRYIITDVTIELSKNSPTPPFYSSLEKYFAEHNINIYTPKIIRDSVLDLRKSKLPDYNQFPSCGSFFKNAVVDSWTLEQIRQNYPDVPAYDMGDKKYKIPTGWLIEKVGLKGKLINGMRVYDKNALVLVNESAKSYQDLAKAREEITRQIYSQFKIQLEQEPLEV